MNPKSFCIALLATASLATALLAPPRSNGQAATDDPALNALLAEVTAQQALVAENQASIDAKLADIGENLRLTRIYAARVGGRGK